MSGPTVVSGVILAAGRSRRMGRPKQLLSLGGRPLLQWAVDAALASRLDEVIVVLGHAADEIRAAVDVGAGTRGRIVVATDYGQGQSASLRAGLQAVRADASAVAILLGDQPGVDAARIDRVVAAFLASSLPIARAAAGREPQPGHPVVVDRTLFAKLQAIEGDRGMRALSPELDAQTLRVPIGSEPLADVNTPEDYRRLVDAAGGVG